MSEQALVGSDAHRRIRHLAALGLTPELPGDLAHLGDGLGRDGLAEAGQAATRVHRDASADLGVAVAQQLLGLALGGGLTMFLAQSPVAPVAAAAIIPAFGVIAVWLYGRHQRRKLNRERLTLHAVISDLTGGLIR